VTVQWLERDRRVVVLSEEVATFGGGAAMNGLRPVVEIMFSSFALVAADQLFNQAGQLGYLYGGKVSVPLVARTRVAIGLGYGAQ
jgi:pyruvate/2-oxoglutarate/acetoin dehydrogenase E1 component